MQYQIGGQLEIRIERIVPNGFGIGFADGLTVFTPLTAPGDRVRVKITQLKKRIAFAEIVDVLGPASMRVEPPCQYFGACGGCDFQQMPYAAQLEAKVGIVRDCLKRIAQIDWPGEILMVPSPQEYGYRSRAQWRIDPKAKRIGYLRRNSHDVVDIETCPILVPALDAELRRVKSEIGWENFWDDTSKIDAAAGEDGAISLYSTELTGPTREISSEVSGEKFSYTAQAFFQGNRYMVQGLVDAALKDVKGDTALDLYSGVGLFTVPIARVVGRVSAVEENGIAVEFAKKNAASAGLTNIEFFTDPVKRFLLGGAFDRVDLILLDPPRSGAEPETIRRITELRPQEISYVSCEPSMLARDLKVFLGSGYFIKFITVLDMFPQTHHTETVVRLGL